MMILKLPWVAGSNFCGSYNILAESIDGWVGSEDSLILSDSISTVVDVVGSEVGSSKELIS